jgi:hypothetical protein
MYLRRFADFPKCRQALRPLLEWLVMIHSPKLQDIVGSRRYPVKQYSRPELY